MKLFLIGGFLGSGKTTAIGAACRELMKNGEKVAVITNDQGEALVDTGFVRSFGIPAEEVTNGCFCCNFEPFVQALNHLSATQQPNIVFAESVGSCTDLVATIAKPLSQFYPEIEVVISVFADVVLLNGLLQGKASFLNDDVRYIYKKQLSEADILILNKTDLLDSNALKEVQQKIEAEYPGKMILLQNSLEARDVQQWLNAMNHFKVQQRTSLELDYDVYAAGEAALAWLDKELVIDTEDDTAYAVALKLVHNIERSIRNAEHPVGHLKFLVDDGTTQQKISYTTVGAGRNEAYRTSSSANHVSLSINARVQTDPLLLEELIRKEVERVRRKTNAQIFVRKLSSFQPSYPKPTHRMAD